MTRAEVFPTIRIDSASTWTLHPGKLVSGLILVEKLAAEHYLMVVPTPNGRTYHVYGSRENLTTATAIWNTQLESKA